MLNGLFFTPFLLALSLSNSSAAWDPGHHRQQLRQRFIRPEEIVDRLNLTPGMTIVDIGAAQGYVSILFAERLKGTGHVFSTDINKRYLSILTEQAKKRNLNNLTPVLVQDEGLDPFYSQHRYDLVYLSNVYHSLNGRPEYFTAFKKFLNPGARLVIVMYNSAPSYTMDDIEDARGLAKDLAREPEGNPFLKNLGPATRQLLRRAAQDSSAEDELKNALVSDFNRILTEPRFYESFYKDRYFQADLLRKPMGFFERLFATSAKRTRNTLPSPARELANDYLLQLNESGALDAGVQPPVSGKTRRVIANLNRFLISLRLGSYLAREGMGAWLPASDGSRNISKYVMLRELERAGYGCTQVMKISEYYDVFILKVHTKIQTKKTNMGHLCGPSVRD